MSSDIFSSSSINQPVDLYPAFNEIQSNGKTDAPKSFYDMLGRLDKKSNKRVPPKAQSSANRDDVWKNQKHKPVKPEVAAKERPAQILLDRNRQPEDPPPVAPTVPIVTTFNELVQIQITAKTRPLVEMVAHRASAEIVTRYHEYFSEYAKIRMLFEDAGLGLEKLARTYPEIMPVAVKSALQRIRHSVTESFSEKDMIVGAPPGQPSDGPLQDGAIIKGVERIRFVIRDLYREYGLYFSRYECLKKELEKADESDTLGLIPEFLIFRLGRIRASYAQVFSEARFDKKDEWESDIVGVIIKKLLETETTGFLSESVALSIIVKVVGKIEGPHQKQFSGLLESALSIIEEAAHRVEDPYKKQFTELEKVANELRNSLQPEPDVKQLAQESEHAPLETALQSIAQVDDLGELRRIEEAIQAKKAQLAPEAIASDEAQEAVGEKESWVARLAPEQIQPSVVATLQATKAALEKSQAETANALRAVSVLLGEPVRNVASVENDTIVQPIQPKGFVREMESFLTTADSSQLRQAIPIFRQVYDEFCEKAVLDFANPLDLDHLTFGQFRRELSKLGKYETGRLEDALQVKERVDSLLYDQFERIYGVRPKGKIGILEAPRAYSVRDKSEPGTFTEKTSTSRKFQFTGADGKPYQKPINPKKDVIPERY